ncbi:MAG: OmpA family protein [Phycisphaerae bacterium]|nr:OmpA family protein [Phycisphaerae bacterium]
MRWRYALGACVILAGLAGCESPGPRAGQTSQQSSATDNEGTPTEIATERARVAALRDENAVLSRERDAARAEAGALQQRVSELEQSRRALARLIEQRASEPLERPAVPASPLPEKIDSALGRFAAMLGDRVFYDRSRGALGFGNDRLFKPGSDEVRSDAQAGLAELAQVLGGALNENPRAEYEIIIIGHTDDSPITRPETLARHATNWHLSVHRAIAVKTALVKAGLPEARMGVMGYGSYRPISNDRERNRRIEIFLVPKGTIQSFEPVKS